MKKLIAVTASLIAAASLSQVSAADVKADKISVSDLFDFVKNNSCIADILPNLGDIGTGGDIGHIGSSETLKELLEKLFEHIKTDRPATPEIPDDDFDSDFNQPDDPADCPDADCPDETPDTPETPDKPSETPDTPSEKPDDSTDNGNTSVSSYANAVLNLVNKYRKQNGLASVKLDSALSGAASTRAKEIVSSFSHTRPNGSSCFTVLSENGISYNGAGENIAYGQSSPDEVMTAWMNSAGHRANILNASFTRLGVGVYESGGTLYWTQLFTY